MAQIGIIGGGIAGMACAYFLCRQHEVTLLEKADYLGGHTNTVTVQGEDEAVTMDTGFMVFNKVTYPHLTRLFEKLEVAIQPTSMSFSVQHKPEHLEYNGSSLNHLFAQRKNLFRTRYWRFLAEINRFNTEASAALQNKTYAQLTLREYVKAKGYSDDLLNLFLIPMSGAVWSTPPEKMCEFPAETLLRFFYNHGFLGLSTQHPWWTVTGGSRKYVQKIIARLGKEKIRLSSGVTRIRREKKQVICTLTDGSEARFDKVIMACHADQVLALLEDPTPLEQSLLSPFHYQSNPTVVHTDASVMPRQKLAWASWNYCIEAGDGLGRSSTHYWMNSLQGVSRRKNYFVSLNSADSVDPKKIMKSISYEHPLFDLPALRAQADLPGLNRLSPDQTTYYCGSYFRYGFHEDALGSAVQITEVLLGESPWNHAP